MFTSPKAITIGLRLRGVDVLTAQEDGMGEASDLQLLDRSAELGRVIFTHDDDFLKEAKRRITSQIDISGVVFAHQLNAPVGRCIEDLEILAKTLEPNDLLNRIEFIPY